jgi:hypothetical protein
MESEPISSVAHLGLPGQQHENTNGGGICQRRSLKDEGIGLRLAGRRREALRWTNRCLGGLLAGPQNHAKTADAKA